jgi:hypothetical protein
LQQNRGDEDDRVYDQNYEKEIVEHRNTKKVVEALTITNLCNLINPINCGLRNYGNHNSVNNNWADFNGFGGYDGTTEVLWLTATTVGCTMSFP